MVHVTEYETKDGKTTVKKNKEGKNGNSSREESGKKDESNSNQEDENKKKKTITKVLMFNINIDIRHTDIIPYAQKKRPLVRSYFFFPYPLGNKESEKS